ncbi:Sensor protein [Paraburkholderia ribeironis]|uniref:histidine kinase n=1 Tax=Paraburkholderia ribeironis TaxID=1247936 RepID=A0A1N7S2F9_9BURK|nr:hybrid sensor histidine kinase/response regulator [Paraburkholderia ribeironis]SIT41514.1 Sensor protein [Paraburkholderia ribeironis]
MRDADQKSVPETDLLLRERVASDLIEITFKFATPAVVLATLFAVILTFTIRSFGYLNPATGLCWVAYIASCACVHILLGYTYKRAKLRCDRWRYWAIGSGIVCFLEGLGWGWASIGLASGRNFESSSLLLLSVAGVSACSVLIFCSHLPSLFALIMPATIPCVIVNFGSGNKVEQAFALYVLIFVGVLAGVGSLANLAVKHGIRLRLKTDEMAVSLRQQKEIAEQARMAAEEASLAKSRFLAAASHDLRQPVHALSLFVGALSGVPMHPRGERLVQHLDASINTLDRLFAALLDISKLDAGVVEVRRQPFSIEAVIARACDDYLGEAEAKGLSFSQVRCRAIVYSDPMLVERIVRNLVSNAVRYTDAGKIVVGCRRQGDHIALQVWDTGRGIPLDQRELVFQEYYQAGNPERDREKGLGLGLAIVSRLARLLGCSLDLRSEPKRGSCFEILLPQASEPPKPLNATHDDVYETCPTGLVVVIDDEREIRAGMSDLLSGWGHTVLAVSSADEAIRLLSIHSIRPALLICDLRLRDGDNGIEAIEKLRTEYNETIPAMLITGDTAAKRLIKAQASELLVLHKPVSNRKLKAAISHLIATGPETPTL